MTLPTGPISFSQINQELQRPATQALSLNDGAVRNLASKPGGAIDMGSLQGKSYVTFNPAPGNYTSVDDGGVNFNIVCSVPAVWTYSRSNNLTGITSTPGSGGTATEMNMFVGATDKISRQCTWTITATAGGISVNYQVTLSANATGTGGTL